MIWYRETPRPLTEFQIALYSEQLAKQKRPEARRFTPWHSEKPGGTGSKLADPEYLTVEVGSKSSWGITTRKYPENSNARFLSKLLRRKISDTTTRKFQKHHTVELPGALNRPEARK